MTDHVSRREVLRTAAAVGAAGAVAGCLGGNTTPAGENGVVAGPDGALVFDPEEITVETGETVTWTFDSPNHNVSAYPDHHETIELPDGAEPFGSMGPDDSALETLPPGEIYEHTFETPGTYIYICVPHVTSGMIGRVVVE
ncbi:MAG: plastocyanin/azurin family copper-binding protein [Halobacteriales archaeon]